MYTKYSFISNVMSIVLHNYPPCHIAFYGACMLCHFLVYLYFPTILPVML